MSVIVGHELQLLLNFVFSESWVYSRALLGGLRHRRLCALKIGWRFVVRPPTARTAVASGSTRTSNGPSSSACACAIERRERCCSTGSCASYLSLHMLTLIPAVNAKRDRVLETGTADLSTDDEEEVFALDGVGSDSDSDLGADDQAADDDADDDATVPSKTDKKPKSKKSKKEGKKSKKSKTDEDEDEEDESWGSKKSAYYAEDVPDEDDEEAEELHAAEARRVQMKARAALTEDDFGMNDLRLDDGPTEDLSKDELRCDASLLSSQTVG